MLLTLATYVPATTPVPVTLRPGCIGGFGVDVKVDIKFVAATVSTVADVVTVKFNGKFSVLVALLKTGAIGLPFKVALLNVFICFYQNVLKYFNSSVADIIIVTCFYVFLILKYSNSAIKTRCCSAWNRRTYLANVISSSCSRSSMIISSYITT